MKIIGLTHQGLVRELNEDSFFISSEPIGNLPNLCIVADGMGGHRAGEIASRLAVEAFVKFCKNETGKIGVEELFIKANEYVNNVIYDNSIHKSELMGMGTTLVACSVIDNILYISNIGDSRLYILEKELRQVTIDHSYVEELIRTGNITRDEGRKHPKRNRITRAIGVIDKIEVDIFTINLKDTYKILICSDGLTSMVLDSKIYEILSNDLIVEDQGEMLINKAVSAGGIDNITLILIDLKA